MIILFVYKSDPSIFATDRFRDSREGSHSDLEMDLSAILRRESHDNFEINGFNVNYSAEKKHRMAGTLLEISKL